MTSLPRVLVSAPERAMRSAMRHALREFSLIETTDDVTTLAMAVACRPDVVVLDATDDTRATRTIATLRADFRTAFTAIVFLVDEAPIAGPVKDAFGGADDYVVCPFDDDELSGRVHVSLRRSGDRLGVNALTGLPGNTAVVDELRARAENGVAFACLHVDLDDFKTFNDRHGFASGDELIRAVARCLVEAVEECAPRSCFVGHVGGDDFVVLTRPEDAQRVAAGIVGCFGDSPEGCSVSIGVVERAHELRDPSGVARAAAEAKARAKRDERSSWASYPA